VVLDRFLAQHQPLAMTQEALQVVPEPLLTKKMYNKGQPSYVMIGRAKGVLLKMIVDREH
jgi:hypothetical protein